MTREQHAYREQLNQLPVVFSLAEMRRILMYPTESAHVTLHRWAAKKFIDPLAPRAGVYFNLEKDRHARDKHLGEAIKRKYPTTRIVGAPVLANHGWTTQIQHTVPLAVNIPPLKSATSSSNGYLNVPEINFSYRTRKWWRAALLDAQDISSKHTHVNGFQAVSPAFALVDMWIHRDNGWFPAPDDLYIDDPAINDLLLTACERLHVDPVEFFHAIQRELPNKSTSFDFS